MPRKTLKHVDNSQHQYPEHIHTHEITILLKLKPNQSSESGESNQNYYYDWSKCQIFDTQDQNKFSTHLSTAAAFQTKSSISSISKSLKGESWPSTVYPQP